MEVIQKSISFAKHCQLAKALIVSVEAIKKQGLEKKAGEVTEILKEIETLAKHYWTLETKTKRVVRDVHSYGGYLIEAADDFTNDHDFEELLINVMNMDDVKISLQKANEEHDIVKGEADKIQVRAQSSGSKYEEKEKKLSLFLYPIKGVAYVSTPVIGQIASFAACGYFAASKTIEECAKNTSANNIPIKMRAEKSAKRPVTDEQRERMVGRMRTRAEELIESCDTYFSKVKTEGRLAIGDNATSSIQEVKKEN